MILGTAGAATVALGSTYLAYTASQEAAKAAREQAAAEAAASEHAAQQARERAEEEARLERERIDYETQLAAENAAYEIKIAEENAAMTVKKQKQQFALVRSAQRAGAAAAGLTPIGSTWAVMRRSEEAHAQDVAEVTRAFDIFATTRTREAEQVAEGGEFGLAQFLARSTRETRFEVENRLAEASLYRRKGSAQATQAHYASYGALLSGAGDMAKIGAGAYDKYGKLGDSG